MAHVALSKAFGRLTARRRKTAALAGMVNPSQTDPDYRNETTIKASLASTALSSTH
jgi:hypothetical protein